MKEGEEVTPLLISWLKRNTLNTAERQEVIELIHQRDEYGIQKYGQRLMTGDGRDTLEDARQEFGDLIQYIFKAKLNGESTKQLAGWLKYLHMLLETHI